MNVNVNNTETKERGGLVLVHRVGHAWNDDGSVD